MWNPQCRLCLYASEAHCSSGCARHQRPCCVKLRCAVFGPPDEETVRRALQFRRKGVPCRSCRRRLIYGGCGSRPDADNRRTECGEHAACHCMPCHALDDPIPHRRSFFLMCRSPRLVAPLGDHRHSEASALLRKAGASVPGTMIRRPTMRQETRLVRSSLASGACLS